MKNTSPVVSFTFDDCPASALHEGGRILEAYQVKGTYYLSLGLLGTNTPTGRIIEETDVTLLLESGHELGCHTFHHLHAWDTHPDYFEKSVIRNREHLRGIAPVATFGSLSYPKSLPRPANKRVAGCHFTSSRGGGQRFNAKQLDLNSVSSFFLEQSRQRPDSVRQIIRENAQANGWLVLSTHDIAKNPTKYGITPDSFEQVVLWVLDSGASILPFAAATRAVCGDSVYGSTL